MGGIPSKPDPSRHLEVICAGYPRTGTVSMQHALGKLLDGPVLHGATHLLTREEDFIRNFLRLFEARRAGDKERALKLAREITRGYVACTDMPFILIIPELLEIYPEAKVVLVTRDPEKWWQSFCGVLKHADAPFLPWLTFIAPALRWFPSLMGEWKRETDTLAKGLNKTSGEYGPYLIEIYNQSIIDLVPKERLLIMDVREGWDPLCKFLGKPARDEPFPRTNDGDAADKVAAMVFGKLMLMWLGLFSAIGGITYLGVRLYRK